MNQVTVDADDLRRLVLRLAGAQDALDAAAKAEERRERGKPMRSITAQERAKNTRKFVAEIADKYDVSLY